MRLQNFLARSELAAESVHEALPAHLVCVSFFAVLYFSAYLGIVLLRIGNRICSGRDSEEKRSLLGPRGPSSSLEEKLEAGANVLLYVPALCILFLATRVWSLHNTQGHLAPWIASTMYLIAGALFVQYIFTVLGSAGTQDNLSFFCVVRVMANGVVHVGAACMVGSILFASGKPSTAMQCIGLLTSIYFVVHLVLVARSLVVEDTDDPPSRSFAQVEHVKETLTLFPMVCVVLVCIRARAHEVDQQPSGPTQDAMLMLTVAATAQVVVVLGQAMSDGSALHGVPTLLSALEVVALFVLYAGVAFVLGELVLLEEVPGGMAVGLPQAMQCVAVLSVLYFLAYFSVLGARWVQYVTWLCSSRAEYTKSRAEKALHAAQNAVVFVPMLCVLMIALQLRAQSLGAHPAWAPYVMWTCVYAQLFRAVLAPIAVYVDAHVFEGQPSTEGSKYWAIGFVLVGFLAQLVVYASLTVLLVVLLEV